MGSRAGNVVSRSAGRYERCHRPELNPTCGAVLAQHRCAPMSLLRPACIRATEPWQIVFRVHRPPCWRRRSLAWRGRRNHKRDPGIPAFRAALRGEFLVGFEVEVSLHAGDRKEVSELWANSEHLGLEATHPIPRAAV